MFIKHHFYIDTNICFNIQWNYQKRSDEIMKKNLKLVAFIYIGIALFTYLLTLRVDRLESWEDYEKQNRTIAVKIR